MNFSIIAFTIHVKPSWGRGGRRGKRYKLRQFGFFPLSPKGSLSLIVEPSPGKPACSSSPAFIRETRPEGFQGPPGPRTPMAISLKRRVCSSWDSENWDSLG